MNAMNDVAEARATESLDAMVLLAVRGFDRIEQLEQQLAATTAGSGEPAERAALSCHSALSSAMPADMPTTPVIVSGVDVAPLALAARILRMVTDEMNEGASELRASVQAARRIVWEVFTDLEVASARGAP